MVYLFYLIDRSNCQQYVHCNNTDCCPFTDVGYARLDWLEHAFIAYVNDTRDASKAENFFSKETCHAPQHNHMLLAYDTC